MAAASLQDVIDKLSANQTANDTHATDIKAGQDEDLIVANKTLKALNKIFNLQINDQAILKNYNTLDSFNN